MALKLGPRRRRSGVKNGSVAASITGAVFVLLGLGIAGLMIYDAVVEWRIARDWERIECRIVESGVQRVDDEQEPYVPRVVFAYEIDGQVHRSDTVRRSVPRFDVYDEAEAVADRYPVDAVRQCRVNPANPGRAVLETGGLGSAGWAVVPLIFATAGVVMLVGVVRKRGEKTAPTTGTTFNPVKKRRILLAIGGVLIVAGGAKMAFWGGPVWARYFDAKDWRPTPCTIESAEVIRHPGDSDSGPTYSVDILYRYEFDGETHRSNTYSFMGGSSSGRAGKQAIVNQYAVGSEATCYVNPDDPGVVVLERGFSWFMLLGLIGVPVALIGAGMVFSQLRGGAGRGVAGLTSEGAPTAAWLPAFDGGGPRRMQPKTGRWMKFAGAIVFACIWNGLSSIFVVEVVRGHLAGKPDWFLTLFMIPFVLVGLAAIGGIFYFFAAALNPRLLLTLSNDAVHPGDTLDVTWDIPARAGRIGKLTLTLEAEEQAEYTRGTNRATDKEVVHREIIRETDAPAEIAEGLASVTLPATAMHSFKFSHNELNWRIHVHGDIAWWPDLKENYPFVVVPPGHALQGASS